MIDIIMIIVIFYCIIFLFVILIDYIATKIYDKEFDVVEKFLEYIKSFFYGKVEIDEDDIKD